MSFPSEQLELTAQAAFGADLTAAPDTWVWTTLTCPSPVNPAQTISRVLDNPITIKRGIAVGGSQQQTTSAAVNLLNLDGALTPELVTSPYWPYVDAGTPFRLRLRTQTAPLLTDTFTRTVASGWGTSDSGTVWTPLSNAGDFSVGSGTAKVTFATNNVTRNIYSNVVARDVEILFDSSVSVVSTSQNNKLGPLLRRQATGDLGLWCAVEYRSSGAVQNRIYTKVGGVDTSLTFGIISGLTYSAGTILRTRVLLQGDLVQMRTWLAAGAEPTTWQLELRQTTISDAGQVGFQMLDMATNTPPMVFTIDNLTVTQPYYDRVQGYIADIQPRFLPQPDGSTWSTAVVTVGGVGILQEKREAPSESPMRRSIRCAPIPPIAYWPLEDAEGSTYGVSAFPGSPRMVVTGPAVFSFSQGTPVETYLSRYGSNPMVSVAAGAKLTASVPRSTVQTEWAVSFIASFFAPDVPGVTEMRIVEWGTTGGTHARWALVATPPGYTVRAYNDAAQTSTNVATWAVGNFDGQPTYTIEASQVGGNVHIELFANDNSLTSGNVAGTLAAVSQVTVNPDQVNTTASVTPFGLKFIVGHLRVVDEISVHDTPFYGVPETGVTVSAIYAWYLEPAHRRLSRLCDEERVPFRFLGDPGTTGMTILNAQQSGAFAELIAEAAEAESGGLLYEAEFGYNYLPRSVRYGKLADLFIDMKKYAGGTDPGDVLVPQLDSRAANAWTISRTNGGSGSYAAPLAYRLRRGTIAESRELDVLTDDDLDQHAAWRTHVNVDGKGANYPGIPIDLAGNPELIDDYLRTDIGSRVNRLNQPTVAGTGVIDQVIEGVSETISPTSWDVTLAATPGTVWEVFVLEDPLRGRLGTDGTVVHGSATSTATSITIDVTAGPRWTTDPAQMPITIGAVETGETMQVTAISGTSNPQTLTVTRSTNGIVRALPALTTIVILDSAPMAL